MHKIVTCAAALLVAACGADAAPQGESWAGDYKAFFDGADGTIKIDPPVGTNPTYTVAMAMANSGCSGEALGSGTAKGNALSVVVPVGNNADGWKECLITLTRSADGVMVSEGTTCRELHGSACAFSGMARKASASEVSAVTSARDAGPEIGGARSFMESGGAVGCPNGPIECRAGRVADRISANDDCDDDVASAETPAALSGASLVGPWAVAGESCRGFGLTLDADGTYTAEGVNGRWRLDGKTLTFTVLETYELGDSAPPVRLPNPTTIKQTVVAWTGATMTLRHPEGTQTLKRCPIEG